MMRKELAQFKIPADILIQSDKDFANIDPKELSDFSVDVHYPGDMFVPDEDETLEYKNLAFESKDFVESKIDKILKSNYGM